MKALMDVYTVFWADLRVLKRHLARTIATSLINPLLYLLAFGYGLGRGISFEGYSYLDFVVPGIIALTAMTSSFNGSSSKLHVDRLFYKCFDEYLMSPVNVFSIAIGKALIGVVRGLLSSAALLFVGVIISPKIVASPLLPMFVLVLVISCFVFAFLGVFVALLAKSHQDMNTFSTLILLPMTFLSSTFFSLEGLPETVRTVLYLLPLTHSSQCLRAAALNQPFPLASLLALIGFGILFFLGSVSVLKKTSV
ncbi:MAG: ABC transporter permease [Candidatus Bathyarchaeales archaeon]